MACGRKHFQLRKMPIIFHCVSIYTAVTCSKPELYFALCLEGPLHAFVC